MQEQGKKLFHLGHMPDYGVRKQIPEHHYNQQKNDGHQKYDQVKGGDNPLQHIVSVLHHAVHGIQSSHQGQHALSCGPDRHNGCYADYPKGTVINTLDQGCQKR